jgi:DNA-binding transcriptional ArsR family regulator
MTYEMTLQALADPTRREVFEALRDGPMAVGEIARGMAVSRPAVSQHLRILKAAGLVTERPEGTRRIYQVQTEGLASLREYLDGFWSDVLRAYRHAAGSRSRGG